MPTPQKSPAAHWLEGTKSQVKPDRNSLFKGGRPRIPSHLTPAAKAEWKRVCKILMDRGTATEGDYATLTVYAEIWSRWVQAKASVATDGLMIQTQVTDNNGNLKTVTRLNPLVKVSESCETRLLSLCKVLGLTPADRDKVRIAASDKPPELDEDEMYLAKVPVAKPILIRTATPETCVADEETESETQTDRD